MTEKKRVGRPSIYSEKIVVEILDELMAGRPLRQICKADHLPEIRTVLYWLRDKPDFFRRYCEARRIQQEIFLDEMHEVAYSQDWDAPNKKIIVDMLKWNMERQSSHRFGGKQTIDHQSSDGSMTPARRNLADFYADDKKSQS